MKTIEAVVKLIEQSGAGTIFGYPGESTLPFYTAVAEESKLKHIVPRCEKGAGYMADAYARISGKVGFLDSPVGIGTPLLTPALNEAFNSSIPLFVLTSGISYSKMEKWPTSQVEHKEMMAPFVKKSVRIEQPSRVGEIFNYLYNLSINGRPGPVHMEIPLDVMESECKEKPKVTIEKFRPAPSPRDIYICHQILKNAQRPIIVAGGGVHLSSAYASLHYFANLSRIPVATTLNGKGSFDERCPLSIGVIGSKGSLSANKILKEADLVIILGSKLGDKTTDAYTLFEGQKVVRVDISSQELARYSYPALKIQADCNVFLHSMLGVMNIGKLPKREEIIKKGKSRKVSPASIMRCINSTLDTDSIVAADASVSCGWAGAMLRTTGSRRNFIAPRGTGSIGYALPAMVGCKEAEPDSHVIGIGGDAGFTMSIQEMETVSRLRHDSNFVLLNDGDYGLLTKYMKEIYGKRSPLPKISVDYERIAEGFGWQYLSIERNSELEPRIFKRNDGPVLIDCKIDEKEYSPDFENTLRRRRK